MKSVTVDIRESHIYGEDGVGIEIIVKDPVEAETIAEYFRGRASDDLAGNRYADVICELTVAEKIYEYSAKLKNESALKDLEVTEEYLGGNIDEENRTCSNQWN